MFLPFVVSQRLCFFIDYHLSSGFWIRVEEEQDLWIKS
jgi:hypothetical protein